jgi:hypothetical protein
MGRASSGKESRILNRCTNSHVFIISSSTVSHLEQESQSDGVPVLYYYFNFREPATQTCENFLRSILRQLLHSSPNIPSALQTLYQRYSNGTRRPSTKDMIKCFLDVVETMKEVRLLGDAFDECNEWNDLWHLLSQISLRKCSSLHFMFTSRPEYSIREAVHALNIPSIDLSLYKSIDRDIASFVSESLQYNPRFSRISDEGKELIRDSLFIRANRM